MRQEVLAVLRVRVVLTAVEEDIVAVGEGFGGDAGAHFGSGAVGMKAHIREVTAETGFHPGLQVACDTAALALERSDAAAELGGQGDSATGMAGADGAGDFSFRDDGVGHLVGFLLVRVSGDGHLELRLDKYRGGLGHGGTGL